MYVIFIVIGLVGDVFFFIGLVWILKLCGYCVSFCIILVFCDVVEQYGIVFVLLSDELIYCWIMGDLCLWDFKMFFGVFW